MRAKHNLDTFGAYSRPTPNAPSPARRPRPALEGVGHGRSSHAATTPRAAEHAVVGQAARMTAAKVESRAPLPMSEAKPAFPPGLV